MAGPGRRNSLTLRLNLENGQTPLSLVVDDDAKEVSIGYSQPKPSAMNRSRYSDKPRWVPPPGKSARQSRERLRGDRELTLDLSTINRSRSFRYPSNNDADMYGYRTSGTGAMHVSTANEDANCLNRIVERLEEGTKAFVNVLRNQHTTMTEQNKEKKLDKLEDGYLSLKSEVGELRKALQRHRKDSERPRKDDLDGLINELEELRSEFDRKARRNGRRDDTRRDMVNDTGQVSVERMHQLGNIMFGDSASVRDAASNLLLAQSRKNGLDSRSNGKVVGNTINRLRVITKENKRLLKEACTREADLIKLQKEYVTKFENLLTEQEVLLRQLNNALGLEGSISEESGDIFSGRRKPDFCNIVAEMEQKTRSQQEAADAIKASIVMLENRMKIKDKEIAELRAHCSAVASDIITDAKAPYSAPNEQESMSKRELEEAVANTLNLKEQFQKKDVKLKFLCNAMKCQYENMKEYLSNRGAASTLDEMRDMIGELYGFIDLILEIPDQRSGDRKDSYLQYPLPEVYAARRVAPQARAQHRISSSQPREDDSGSRRTSGTNGSARVLRSKAETTSNSNGSKEPSEAERRPSRYGSNFNRSAEFSFEQPGQTSTPKPQEGGVGENNLSGPAQPPDDANSLTNLASREPVAASTPKEFQDVVKEVIEKEAFVQDDKNPAEQEARSFVDPGTPYYETPKREGIRRRKP